MTRTGPILLACIAVAGCVGRVATQETSPARAEPRTLSTALAGAEIARAIQNVWRWEEERLRRLFAKIRPGMTKRQVRRTMGREPDWRRDALWGYLLPPLPLYSDVAPEQHPGLVVHFDSRVVSRTEEQPPGREYVARIWKDAEVDEAAWPEPDAAESQAEDPSVPGR